MRQKRVKSSADRHYRRDDCSGPVGKGVGGGGGGGVSSAADVKGFANRPRSIDSKSVVVKGYTVAAPSAVQYR